MNREIYANTNSLERVPSLKSLLFRHLLFKLGRAGHGPWAGHASVGLGLGLAAGGDRCARDAARQNRQ